MGTSKTGTRRRDSAATRRRILEATRSLLVDGGFAAATTRAIADEAECNQGLISYHFRGLNPLLLEVLDASSEQRLAVYRSTLSTTRGMRAVRAAGRELYEGDHASGHTKILSELVAGGLMDATLGVEVARRVQPWLEVAELALRQAVPAVARRRLPVKEAAHALVAMFVGLELLGSLTGDRNRSLEVVSRLSQRWVLRPPEGG